MEGSNPRNKLIVKSNELIESKYHLSVREQKFLIYLASLAKRGDEDYTYTRVKIKDIEAALKIGEDKKWGSIYDVVREIVLSINKKPISIRKPNGGWTIVNWFSAVDADPSNGMVTFELSGVIKSQLVKLNEYFTKYKFGNILALRSGYSIRIYELLKLNQYLGHITYELSYLRELIGVSYMDEKHEWIHKYAEYKAFKRSILVHAQKELKRETDIYFELKEVREGRSVKYITFYIFKNKAAQKNTQTELFIDNTSIPTTVINDKTVYNEAIINAFVLIGLMEKRAKEIFREGFNMIEEEAIRKEIANNGRSLEEYFLEKVDYVNFAVQKERVSNPPGLLIQAIKENYKNKKIAQVKKKLAARKQYDEAERIKKELKAKLSLMQKNLYDKEMNIIDELIKGNPTFLEETFAGILTERWRGYDATKNIQENYLGAKGTLKAKFTTKIKELHSEHFDLLEIEAKKVEHFKKQLVRL